MLTAGRYARSFHRFVAGAVLALCAAAPAAAQQPLPAPVEEALATMEARFDPDTRWAYTRTRIENGKTTVERFDPRRPEDDQWFRPRRTMTAEEAEVDGVVVTGQAELDQPCDLPVDDRQLLRVGRGVAGLRALFGGGLEPADAPEGQLRYAFRPPEEMPPSGIGCARRDRSDLIRHLQGEVILTDGEPGLAIRLYAAEPFRFSIVRVRELEYTTRYGEVAPEGPFAPLTFTVMASGLVLVFKQSSDRTITHSDFEAVEVATPPS